HHWALAGMAVAGAAEHDDEAAARIGAQRIERLGERVGLVGVVDEDRCAVLLTDEIEPAAGAAQRSKRGEHGLGLAAGRDRKPGGDERILDLECAGKRQPYRVAVARIDELEPLREPLDRGLDEADALTAPADREQAQTVLLRGPPHPVARA